MINAGERGAELATLAQPGQARRDVLVLICTRTTTGGRPIPKRQQPSTGVLIVADRLEPALLLEAAGWRDRSGGRSAGGQASACHHPTGGPADRDNGQRYGVGVFVGAGGVGTTTRPSTWPPPSRGAAPGPHPAGRPHISSSDSAGFWRRTALLDGRRSRYRIASITRSSEPDGRDHGPKWTCCPRRIGALTRADPRVRTLLEFASATTATRARHSPSEAVLDALEGF